MYRLIQLIKWKLWETFEVTMVNNRLEIAAVYDQYFTISPNDGWGFMAGRWTYSVEKQQGLGEVGVLLGVLDNRRLNDRAPNLKLYTGRGYGQQLVPLHVTHTPAQYLKHTVPISYRSQSCNKTLRKISCIATSELIHDIQYKTIKIN